MSPNETVNQIEARKSEREDGSLASPLPRPPLPLPDSPTHPVPLPPVQGLQRSPIPLPHARELLQDLVNPVELLLRQRNVRGPDVLERALDVRRPRDRDDDRRELEEVGERELGWGEGGRAGGGEGFEGGGEVEVDGWRVEERVGECGKKRENRGKEGGKGRLERDGKERKSETTTDGSSQGKIERCLHD